MNPTFNPIKKGSLGNPRPSKCMRWLMLLLIIVGTAWILKGVFDWFARKTAPDPAG